MEYIARGHDILPGCRYCLKEQTISHRRRKMQMNDGGTVLEHISRGSGGAAPQMLEQN